MLKNKCKNEHKIYEYSLEDEGLDSPPTLPTPPSNSIGDGLDEALRAHQIKNKAPLLPRSVFNWHFSKVYCDGRAWR